MENEFKTKKLEIDKKVKRILLYLLLAMFFQIGLAYVDINNVMFMVEMMLGFIGMPEWKRNLLLNLSSTMMLYLPMVVTIMCNIKIMKLNKERHEIRDKEIEYLCKKAFEENKHKIDKLLDEGRSLSRSELIHFLNKTKTEIVKAEKNNKFKCKSVDILMLNYLQDGLEDILFPSIVDENKGYTKVRKK